MSRRRSNNPSRKATLPEVGGSPGALVYLGRHKVEKPTIRVICFNSKEIIERQPETIAECKELIADPSKVSWIDVAGLENLAIIQEVGTEFGIHHLVLEDILSARQRPKFESYKRYLFLVLRTLITSENSQDEQVSIILGPRFVLSFQEREEDLFAPVRSRLRAGRPRIRGNGADYLAYALVDTIVDGYFVLLESMSDQIDALGDQLLTDAETAELHDIFRLKRVLGAMRRSVWPIRDVINQLTRGESELIQESTVLYLHDVYDHAVRAIETVEALRDLSSGLHDLYLSVVSYRLNEVMKVLTIIATIFIPLTFIAGVYGMNFKFMPELDWYWAYPATWLVMILIVVVMVIYFRRKNWL